MLRVSSKLRNEDRKGSKKSGQRTAARARAVTNLLRAQCNDAYWHGIFGGLYAPHLRTALWRDLVRAETTADALRHGAKKYQVMTRLDFDADGREEIEITSPQFAALIKPSAGGTLEVLDFRPSAVTLVNSLQRRVEAYHSRQQHATQTTERVASIHDQTLAKEAGLEKRLKYDRWPRNTFRLLLFANGKTHADFEALRLEESAPFAGGDYRIEEATAQEIQLVAEGSLCKTLTGAGQDKDMRVAKTFKFDWNKKGFTVACQMDLTRLGSAAPAQFTVGLEIVLNLLAPNVPDRYFEFSGGRKPLEWSGVVEGSHLRLADEWQDVAVEIEAQGASQVWVAPVETVSESEEGFERVYQGSQILAVWNVDLGSTENWKSETVLRVTTANRS
jgi:alpha-amylase